MQQTDNRAVKKGCTCGVLGCGGGVIGIFAFVGLILYLTMFSNTCARMMGEETYPIAGDPSRFDPEAAVAEIRAKVGGNAILLTADFRSVRSDGTMDLKATYKPAPEASYTFQRKLDAAPEGQTAPPIGAGRGPDDVWVESVTVRVYEPGQRRHVRRISGGSSSSYSYTNEGMDIDRSTPSMTDLGNEAPIGKVSVKKMWEVAKKIGATDDAVASIRYNDGYAEFSITGTKIFLRWDEKGELDEHRLTDEQAEKLGVETTRMRIMRESEERRKEMEERLGRLRSGARN